MTGTAWNDFWTVLPTEPGAALWDSSPELTAARHLPLFRDRLDPLLPLIDIGCGSGRQTQLLERSGLDVVADGDIPLHTTENDSGGRPLELPTSYVVARAVTHPRHEENP
ncbi:hypothetical protein [Frankia sp. Cr1]|uniref:hypothetical protein n=1 Tax=Frankia sp. Cr1 TaxID=3073931 RepID=UPI002AD1E553|nr:hypothetical protein [Frankia sp. Cr1]